MTTFNNAIATKEAKASQSWDFIGNSYTTDWCRAKCIELASKGLKAFYKKAKENGETKYFVYTY